jgi:stage II sporulation protein D
LFLGGFTTTLSVLITLLPIGCSQGCNQNRNLGTVPNGTPAVRVLLLENRASVNLSATEQPTVQVGSGPIQVINLSGGATVAVSLTPAGWRVGAATLGGGTLTVRPAIDGSVRVDRRAYRGRFRFVPASAGRFNVINDVDVDGYLMSVVPREMYSNWHVEAYRAQAIVARTYALYVARTSASGTTYDLFADTRSQVYGGISDETARSRDAVDSTRGIVVAYGPPGREKIFKAYFSSCCGGVTQSAADAFGDPLFEPLSEQNIGPRCVESGHFNWGPVAIRKAELTRRMRLWGAANNQPEKGIGDVSRIDIESNNRFGRPRRFVITDARGYRYSLNSEDFRHSANYGATDGITLGSSFCKPVNDPTVVRFTEGHGLGHGVGLCQWCAEHEAETGTSHESIVLDAFPHAKLVRAY